MSEQRNKKIVISCNCCFLVHAGILHSICPKHAKRRSLFTQPSPERSPFCSLFLVFFARPKLLDDRCPSERFKGRSKLIFYRDILEINTFTAIRNISVTRESLGSQCARNRDIVRIRAMAFEVIVQHTQKGFPTEEAKSFDKRNREMSENRLNRIGFWHLFLCSKGEEE